MTKKEVIVNNKAELQNTLSKIVTVAKSMERSMESLNIDSSKNDIDSTIEYMVSMVSILNKWSEFTKIDVQRLSEAFDF